MSDPSDQIHGLRTVITMDNTPDERRRAAQLIIHRLGDGPVTREIMAMLFGKPHKTRK